LVVAAGARKDLRAILRYTERRWGSGQRAVYRSRLDDAMQGLLVHPHRGQQRDDLSPGMHSLTVSAHVLFYRIGEDDITIVRILHGAMDATAVFE
jgi:toxin ParE1/3/4